MVLGMRLGRVALKVETGQGVKGGFEMCPNVKAKDGTGDMEHGGKEYQNKIEIRHQVKMGELQRLTAQKN